MFATNFLRTILKKKIRWLLASLFPDFFVSKAFAFLTTPMQHKIRPHEIIQLENAQKEHFLYLHFDIQLYQWGTGTKHILLVHGWEGHAGNFADLIPRLIENNYCVHAFDGPSHGASSKGETSSFEFTNLVEILIRKFDITQVVSHSFGSVASLIALGTHPELKIDRYVGFTVPNKFRERLEEITAQIGLPNTVVDRLIKKIEAANDIKVDEVNVEDYAQRASIQKALLLHDKNDRVLPFEKSREVAGKWRAAELIEIEGTGHYKILRVPEVLDKAIHFLVN